MMLAPPPPLLAALPPPPPTAPVGTARALGGGLALQHRTTTPLLALPREAAAAPAVVGALWAEAVPQPAPPPMLLLVLQADVGERVGPLAAASTSEEDGVVGDCEADVEVQGGISGALSGGGPLECHEPLVERVSRVVALLLKTLSPLPAAEAVPEEAPPTGGVDAKAIGCRSVRTTTSMRERARGTSEVRAGDAGGSVG